MLKRFINIQTLEYLGQNHVLIIMKKMLKKLNDNISVNIEQNK